MDMKKLAMGVVAMVVAIVIVVTCAIPIISDSVATEDTFTNDGYFHMKKYGTDTDVTISWDHTKPKVITVNDTDYTLTLPYNQWTSVVIADDWYFRYADGLSAQFVQVSYGGIANIPGASNSSADLEVVCSNGTATVTSYSGGEVNTTKTVSYTTLYVISDDNSPYVMKKSTESAYMNKDSIFVGLGTTGVGSSEVVLCRVDGTIDDGATVTVIASSNSDVTLKEGSVVVNATELSNGHIGYALSTIQFDVTKSDVDTAVTYSYYVVPATVDLERSVHVDGPTGDILAVIPILMVLGIVIGAVALFLTTRRD